MKIKMQQDIKITMQIFLKKKTELWEMKNWIIIIRELKDS